MNMLTKNLMFSFHKLAIILCIDNDDNKNIANDNIYINNKNHNDGNDNHDNDNVTVEGQIH